MSIMKKYLLETLIFGLLSLLSIGLLVSITIINPLPYDMTWDAKNYQYHGDEARGCVWLILFASSVYLVYIAVLSLIRLRNPNLDQSRHHVCQDCGEPFSIKHSRKPLVCPKCGGRKIEELNGFFERHPDKKIEYP